MGEGNKVLLERSALILVKQQADEFEFVSESLRAEVKERRKSERRKSVRGLREEKEKAESTAKLKDKFIALVSHDVRSPLTTIIGLLNLIQENVCTAKATKCKELIGRALFSCQNLCDMVEELLSYSRLQTGAIKPKLCFFNANTLVTESIESLSYLADKKGVEVCSKIPSAYTVYADRVLFAEVMRNLISNAIKFSTKGDAPVEIYLPNQLSSTMAVKDNGTGMSKKTVKNLFKHEEKTTSKGTAGEIGTGLGMPYSYDIMHSHGGRLTVESTSDEGTLFYLSLPDVKPVFLIVDDEELDRVVLKELLSEFQPKFLEAENGEIALEMLQNGQTPHLILSDLQMPVMEGFELLAEIRKIQAIKHIPSMMLTNDKSQGVREKLFDLGADDFLNKPFSRENLIPRVKKLLTLNCMRH